MRECSLVEQGMGDQTSTVSEGDDNVDRRHIKMNPPIKVAPTFATATVLSTSMMIFGSDQTPADSTAARPSPGT